MGRAWVLGSVEGKASFSMDVEVVEGDLSGFGMGIVDDDASLNSLAALVTASDHCDFALYRAHFGSKCLFALDAKCMFDNFNIDGARRVRMEFVAGCNPRLLYTIDERPAIDVTSHLPKPLQPRSYKPCVSLNSPSLKFRCHIAWRHPKRTLEGAAFAWRASRGLWDRRRYADVVVRTSEGHQIPCHRALLAEGSPVFAAEFDRWVVAPPQGQASVVDVSGERQAVEPMLQFFYTGELESSADAAAVLPLAHCYQVEDLVSIAVTRILENITPENIVAAARALRPLRREEGLRLVWREFCMRAAHDPSAVEALMLEA